MALTYGDQIRLSRSEHCFGRLFVLRDDQSVR
jgi:hypothetical protein